ncbi:MAG: hypothetical protein M1834_001448 [Cirrosporium novae-zelandiae]|nr:MAG: hypothetical protein M1834_001448 [Cirrosporium novae-zelandiae]
MRGVRLGRGLLGASLGLSYLSALVSASHSVNVALKASFSSAPYLLELLETAAEENSTSYFPILDRIADGYFTDASTDQELYTQFLELLQQDGHIIDPEALSSFQYAVSIHSAAPRIEAEFQFYDASVGSSMMAAQDAACPVWIHFNGKQYCSPGFERSQQDVINDRILEKLPFDRILGSPAAPPAILYADIMSPMFGEFHSFLRQSALSSEISYRLRYRTPSSENEQPLYVNGYGVELALKKTDYIVIDDRNVDEAHSEDESKVASILEEKESVADLKPLSTSEVLELGIKAASFVMNREDKFDTLLKLSQDFPKHSSLIALHNTSSDFLAEFRQNRETLLPPGFNGLWINGVQLDNRQVDAFTLLDHLRHERGLVNGLRDLKLTGPQAAKLLSHEALYSSTGDDQQRYDYRDEIEGGGLIIWCNDIEKDKRYESWPKALKTYLSRTYPGQLPAVRRDLNNVLLPVDFSDPADVDLVVEGIQTFVKRKIPIQFGLVPVLHTKAAADQAKVAYHLVETYGLGVMFQYFGDALNVKKLAKLDPQIFKATVEDHKTRGEKHVLAAKDVLASPELGEKLSKVGQYLARLGLSGSARPPLFVNGAPISKNDHWLPIMSNRINMDIQAIKREIAAETLEEDTWLPSYYLNNSLARRNQLIVPEDESSIKILDVGKLYQNFGEILEKLPVIKSELSAEEQIPAQLIIATDLDSKYGIKLINEILEFRKEQPEAEIYFLHNYISATSEGCLSHLFGPALKDGSLEMSTAGQRFTQAQMSSCEAGSSEREASISFWKNTGPLINALGLKAGESGIFLNGRVVGPIVGGTAFTKQDFKQLFDYEQSKRIKPARNAMEDLGLGDKLPTALENAKLSSLLALSTTSDMPQGIYDYPNKGRSRPFDEWNGTYSSITKDNKEDASIEIVAVIDPASEGAQRWLPVLNVLSELEGTRLTIFLNPQEKLQELPIKRFYRYVLRSKPTFNDDGSLQIPQASFKGVPEKALLNLGMDVPSPWLVAPKESIYDLDNIRLNSLKEGADVDAIYELESILIEGHSRDLTTGEPPRGAQLVLGTDKQPNFADTIIMANLGYFQFKAKPGYWKIQLKEGRSQQIFHIDSLGTAGYKAPSDNKTEIALTSFLGKTLFPRLSRKPGQEEADVLEESARPGSPRDILSKGFQAAQGVLSSFGLAKVKEHADINIFSVASGHLYERMLNIMMVSVMKHTKHTVKFWFIEQFLSPSFKSFLPHLATEYGFEYEMVTYKWPHWLRAQKEKQREIWGYKMLFLDVLFPLSLDKVIFVDADQIVRTDMYDLVTHDLEGAPYGFTPMCDSRESMEGFRFWKTGYWRTQLRGRPYHISALYVVDLRRFREVAAGDRLRQQYQMLSADPASLSNLDQDLPNNMQMMLPIHSLPREWLWCETWCADEELDKARTIDLCNNPLTKEPKLERARRQVPEWTVYDDEIAELTKKVQGNAKVEIVEEQEKEDADAAAAVKIKHEEL